MIQRFNSLTFFPPPPERRNSTPGISNNTKNTLKDVCNAMCVASAHTWLPCHAIPAGGPPMTFRVADQTLPEGRTALGPPPESSGGSTSPARAPSSNVIKRKQESERGAHNKRAGNEEMCRVRVPRLNRSAAKKNSWCVTYHTLNTHRYSGAALVSLFYGCTSLERRERKAGNMRLEPPSRHAKRRDETVLPIVCFVLSSHGDKRL